MHNLQLIREELLNLQPKLALTTEKKKKEYVGCVPSLGGGGGSVNTVGGGKIFFFIEELNGETVGEVVDTWRCRRRWIISYVSTDSKWIDKFP